MTCMTFIYRNWVCTWWQWSVDLYKNRKETAQKEQQYTKKKYKKQQNTEYIQYKLFWIGRNIYRYQT